MQSKGLNEYYYFSTFRSQYKILFLMKNISFLLLIILISTTSLFSQVEVPKGKYPFYKIVEWPNQGSILLAKDPSGSTNDIYINLLDTEGEVPWGKTIYPKVEDPKLIISNNSNYIYFVDNYKPVKNFIEYNQLNQSGGVVSTKFDVLQVIRSYGYTTPNDLELMEIINTPKSLVFYFQLPVKSEGIIENIFISITHHNNRLYHYKGPATDMKLQKKGTIDPILFAGADESTINFSYFSTENDKNNVNFIGFSPKGEPVVDQYLKIPSLNPIVSNIRSLNLDGSEYIDDKSLFQSRGKGVYLNNNYYFLTNDISTNCLIIYGLNEDRKVEQLNKCNKNQANSRNPKSSISYFELDGDLIVTSEMGDVFTSYKIDKNGIETLAINKKDIENVQLNSSSFKTKDKTTNFVHVINGIPYSTDTKELEKLEKITFKK